MSNDLLTAVSQASAKWQTAFNSGSASECASFYEDDALMIASPFGEFRGRESIEQFWREIISEGFSDIRYIEPRIVDIDETSAVLSADWEMNKAKGIITKELWVLQDDGTALLREDHFEARD